MRRLEEHVRVDCRLRIPLMHNWRSQEHGRADCRLRIPLMHN